MQTEAVHAQPLPRMPVSSTWVTFSCRLCVSYRGPWETWCWSLGHWLISPSIVVWSWIHLVGKDKDFFFFLAKQLIVCICHIFFIQSSVASGLIPNLSYWELNYNKHEGTQNSHMLTSFHLGKFPGVRRLGHSLVDLFSCVWGVSILLSVTVVTLTFPPAVD